MTKTNQELKTQANASIIALGLLISREDPNYKAISFRVDSLAEVIEDLLEKTNEGEL